MQKLTLLFLFVCVIYFKANAQVNFQEFGSFKEVLTKAKSEKKLIFIQVKSLECDQCNIVAKKGLSSTSLKEKFEFNFVSLETSPDQLIYKEIVESLNIEDQKMGSLFFDEEGYLLVSMASTHSSALIYLENADQTIQLSKNNPMKELESFYLQNPNDKDLLIKLITKKNAANFNTDKLLEKYLELHTIKDFCTLENAKLILEQGPALESKTRKFMNACFSNKEIDSLFNSYSSEKRSKINQKTINATNKAAIQNKNKNLAIQLSNFIANSYGKNYERANIERGSYLLNFYYNIKDTINFNMQAANYCDYSLMKIPVDTLIKKAKIERNAVFAKQLTNFEDKKMKQISFSSYYQKFATDLNNAAFGTFLFSKDLEKIAKALKWSKRSLEIYDALSPNENLKNNPAFLDTYACLLFKLGQKEEAIQTELLAIQNSKKQGFSSLIYEERLKKITENKL